MLLLNILKEKLTISGVGPYYLNTGSWDGAPKKFPRAWLLDRLELALSVPKIQFNKYMNFLLNC